ncbi:hypothetical protein [Burkholderia alba]|nr:hypothetical protein [Burkholderia alba]
MHFALLVSDLPHVSDSRAYYDPMLSLDGGTTKRRSIFGVCRDAFRALFR